MHKNKINIFVFAIILIALLLLCIAKRNEIHDLKNEKKHIEEKQTEFLKLSNQISKTRFNFTKMKEELIKRNQNIKKILAQISKKSHIKKVKFRNKENEQKTFKEFHIEIHFIAEREQDIYHFMQNLHNKLNIIFDSIKIIKKDKKNFAIYIKCRCFEYKYLSKSINIEPKKSSNFYFSHLRLFPKDEEKKKYLLQGIIDETKAYINDEWKQIGDFIDEYEIKEISERSILIEKDGKQKKIKLGDSW